MLVDATLILLDNVDVTATVNSSVIDLGADGPLCKSLYLNVKLTKALTAGAINSIKVQSSADGTSSFSTPHDEVTFIPNATQDEPGNLVQAFMPLAPKHRYVRIVVDGDGGDDGTDATGGKLWAALSTDVQVPL